MLDKRFYSCYDIIVRFMGGSVPFGGNTNLGGEGIESTTFRKTYL